MNWYQVGEKPLEDCSCSVKWPGRQPNLEEWKAYNRAFEMGFAELTLTYQTRGYTWWQAEKRAHREQSEYSDHAWQDKMLGEGRTV